MQKFLRSLVLGGFLVTAAFAAERLNIGVVKVEVDGKTIPIRVSANNAELDALAQRAFESHGRYKRVASGFAFDIRFSLAGTNQVRVDVLRGGATVSSDTASGANARQALLRAADIAVVKTNGENLRGFFTAQLAFIGERPKPDIFTSDLFLGDVLRRTEDRAPVLTPRWSPDGSKLLFTSFYKSGFPDIFQYDMRTYQKTVFASLKGTNTGARFSPNGQQVAMVLTGEGNSEIYVTGAQGPARVDASARRTRSDRVKSSPVWSPDGSRLIFEMEPGPQLYVMSAGGGQPSRVTPTPGYMAEADWSRTSNKIVCTRQVAGRFQIAVIDAIGGEAKVVSKASFDAVEPSWLADGRHVVYTARDRSSSVLCILDTETGKSTPLTTNFGTASKASVWTPAN